MMCYLDQVKTLENQLNLYKELSLSKMPLRKINNENLYFKDDDYLDFLFKTFKEQKVVISYLDLDIPYTLLDPIDLDRVFYISKVLSVKDVVLLLPKIEDFEIEKEILTNQIKDFLGRFKKEKIQVTFHVNYEIDSAYIAYLIKEFKEILFTFNPAQCYFYDKAVSTYHRLLKNNLSHVILYDMDEYKEIALLGYGEATILDTLDRLKHDKYKGEVILDTNLLEYIENRQAIYSKLFKLPIFRSNKSKKAYQVIEDKLRLTKEKEITFSTLYASQIQLVKRYLK